MRFANARAKTTERKESSSFFLTMPRPPSSVRVLSTRAVYTAEDSSRPQTVAVYTETSFASLTRSAFNTLQPQEQVINREVLTVLWATTLRQVSYWSIDAEPTIVRTLVATKELYSFTTVSGKRSPQIRFVPGALRCRYRRNHRACNSWLWDSV